MDIKDLQNEKMQITALIASLQHELEDVNYEIAKHFLNEDMLKADVYSKFTEDDKKDIIEEILEDYESGDHDQDHPSGDEPLQSGD